MTKIIEMVYTYDQLKEVKQLLDQNNHVCMDVKTAYHVLTTFLTDQEIRNFAELGRSALQNANFKPLLFDERVKDYFKQHLLLQGEQRRDINVIQSIVDDCEIYAQRYYFLVAEPKSYIFIERTPTQRDFDVAILKLISFLDGVGKKSANINGIIIRKRGQEKFIDVIIQWFVKFSYKQLIVNKLRMIG